MRWSSVSPRGFVDTGSNETGRRGFYDDKSKLTAKQISRRALLRTGALAAGGIAAVSWPSLVRSAPVNIRYSTGGGIGPNEMETLIWLDYLKSNVLKNYGKAYTLDMTFTRGSPEAAQLLAAGQVDLAALSSPAFAATMAKDAVPGGISIISDIYQDGHPGFASNTFFVYEGFADQDRRRPQGQEGRHQCLRLGGRSGAARGVEESGPRSPARPADRRGDLSEYRGRDARGPGGLRRARHPVHAGGRREGRSARTCSPAATRSAPRRWCSRSRPTSSFASSPTLCARSSPTSCRASIGTTIRPIARRRWSLRPA